MSEHKNEETKSPLARRGARPFVGPAGGSAPARPFFKPAIPGSRVATTPLTPPSAPPRPALGTPPIVAPQPTPVALPPVEPREPQAIEAAPLAAEAAPLAVEPFETNAPTFDITVPEAIAQPEPPVPPVTEPELPTADHWSVAVTPTYTPTFQSVVEEIPPADDVVSTIPAEQLYASEPPTTRPVTSEMVAIDAFEAFETVWDAAPQADPSLPDEAVASAPLDDDSLGSGIDAQQVWGEEITQDTGDYQAVYDAQPETPAVAASEPEAIEPGWASRTTPELPMPAWLADDSHVDDASAAEEMPGASLRDELPPAAHEASASSIVGSVRPEMPWSDPRLAAYAAFVTSPDGVPAITHALANDKQARGLQVSAALERLAERIRDGEIDVSSVAPEAPDAAMLASVLAALLGGSKNR